MDRALQLMKEQVLPTLKFNVGVRTLGLDSSRQVGITVLGTPAASIGAIRFQDLDTPSFWFNVYPENQQAKCRGGGNFHIVFGAYNNGTDGNIWGKLTDDAGVVLIATTTQWCAHGALQYWERDAPMPQRNYTLTCEVGH